MNASCREPTDWDAALGDAVRHVRWEKDLSQEEVARAAGMASSQVGAIERGVHSTRLKTLMRILKGLKVTPSEFFRDARLRAAQPRSAALTPSPRRKPGVSDLEHLGRQLRDKRVQLGQVQEALAHEVGISRGVLIAIESGSGKDPRVRVLLRILEALALDPAVVLACLRSEI